MKSLIIPALAAALLAGLSACNGNSAGSSADSFAETPDTLTHHARYLTISRRPDGAVLVDIANPWDTDKAPLASYVLVHRDSAIPENLPEKAALIRVPVKRAAVYSSVHTSALGELGTLDAIAAVADRQYFPESDTVVSLIASGRIADIGTSASPSAERLAASRSEAVLRSPMQDIVSPPLPSGIVPVEMTDYMEPSPIGRAEWLLLLGELFDRRDTARSIFDNVINDYNNLVIKASLAQTPRPKVLVETEYSGVWYIPAGKSYQARMLADAGAYYPWEDTEGQGSLTLSLENVAAKAIDADMWLIRSYGYETGPSTLIALNPRYAAFKAVKDKAIYSCNSSARPIFNDIAFHPERILADYVAIFHPELMPDYSPRYFHHITE